LCGFGRGKPDADRLLGHATHTASRTSAPSLSVAAACVRLRSPGWPRPLCAPRMCNSPAFLARVAPPDSFCSPPGCEVALGMRVPYRSRAHSPQPTQVDEWVGIHPPVQPSRSLSFGHMAGSTFSCAQRLRGRGTAAEQSRAEQRDRQTHHEPPSLCLSPTSCPTAQPPPTPPRIAQPLGKQAAGQ
jgi:hypothetical protein